jgi:hypothetical protein
VSPHAKDAKTRMLVLCPGFSIQLDLQADGSIVPTMLVTSLLAGESLCTLRFTTLKRSVYLIGLSEMTPTSVLYGKVESLSELEYDLTHGAKELPSPSSLEVRNLVSTLTGCAATVVPYCKPCSVINLEPVMKRAKLFGQMGFQMVPMTSPHLLVQDVYCAWHPKQNNVVCLLCQTCYPSPQHFRQSACFPHGHNDLFVKGCHGRQRRR